jgi:hypothetical protein
MNRVAFLATLLIALAACGHGRSTPDDRDELVHFPGLLRQPGESIIVVRVVESGSERSGKVLVLKSLWGPFSPGEVLHVTGSMMTCIGNLPCEPYPLYTGDELLVFTGTAEPIVAQVGATWPAAEPKSQALMAAVDRAVKERYQAGGVK